MKKLTTEEFIKRAFKVHGSRYEYPDEYINNSTKIRIICKKHGEFWQSPNVHLNRSGCQKCGNVFKHNTSTFIKRAFKVHGSRYEYPDEYINNSTKIRIICKTHGEFWQTPNNHLSGANCKLCVNNNIKLTTKNFIENAVSIHGTVYKYPDEYVNAHTKIRIFCPVHGDFFQRPADHITNKTGCPSCYTNYSKVSILWLESIMKRENIFIEHAENIGEYKILGTNYRADGYCKETNTIYEFYGDIWHGNLDLFDEDEICSSYLTECAGSLYIKTMQREEKIKKMGYNLITIWENDYKKLGVYS